MARRLKKISIDKATADAVNAEMENTQEQGYAWLLSRLLTVVSPTVPVTVFWVPDVKASHSTQLNANESASNSLTAA